MCALCNLKVGVMFEDLTINLDPDEWMRLVAEAISRFKVADTELPEVVLDATTSSGQLVALHMRLTHFSIIDLMVIGLTDNGLINVRITDTNHIIAILDQEGTPLWLEALLSRRTRGHVLTAASTRAIWSARFGGMSST